MKKTTKGVCSKGFKAAGVREGKYGVAVILSDKVCTSAGVFTKHNIKAAPIVLTKKVIANGLQAIVANSGNANACVKDGINEAKGMADTVSKELGISSKNIGVASTGIIGRKLDLKIVGDLIKKASTKLSTNGSLDAAKSIMTTDTKPKQVSVEYNGVEVGGICKGAGMIAPDMATMLCFITTNAKLSKRQLQKALKDSVDKSFNMTIVEGDMSTNDTVLLLSNGSKECSLPIFQELLDCVTLELAKMMAYDGEGASKYIEIKVKGANNDKKATQAALTIAKSPLVKTAFRGENPNWGRIIAAAGSKIKFNPMNVTIEFKSKNGTIKIFDKGKIGDRSKGNKVLKAREIKVTIDLRQGKGNAIAYTCDLTEGYVKVNADYN